MREDEAPTLPRWYVIGTRIIDACMVAVALGAAATVAVAVTKIIGQ